MVSKLAWQFYCNTESSQSLRGFTQRGFGFMADVDYLHLESPTKVFVGLSQHDTFGPFIGQMGHLWRTDSPHVEECWGGIDYYTFNAFGELTGRKEGATYHLSYDDVALDDPTTLHLISAARDLQRAHPEIYSSLEACISGLAKSPRKE